jgi:predicted nucleic acid-binding Zn ribbon protein
MAKKKTPSRREIRNLRLQNIIFITIGILVILAMVLSLIK